MFRIVLALIFLTLASALGVVTLQFQSRKLVTALEKEQARARALEVEWGQLNIESSMLSAHMRVEEIARKKLGMASPGKDSLFSVDPQRGAQ